MIKDCIVHLNKVPCKYRKRRTPLLSLTILMQKSARLNDPSRLVLSYLNHLIMIINLAAIISNRSGLFVDSVLCICQHFFKSSITHPRRIIKIESNHEKPPEDSSTLHASCSIPTQFRDVTQYIGIGHYLLVI